VRIISMSFFLLIKLILMSDEGKLWKNNPKKAKNDKEKT